MQALLCGDAGKAIVRAESDGGAIEVNLTELLCADCGAPIGHDKRPKDGWQLEDDRTVCNACCVADTKKQVNFILATGKMLEELKIRNKT